MEKKTTIPGVYKDTETGALLNKDNTALEAYKKHKARNLLMSRLEKKVAELEGRIRILEAKP